MTKNDIIGNVWKKLHGLTGISKRDVSDVVNCSFDEIEESLLKGEEVRVVGLGKFFRRLERMSGFKNNLDKEPVKRFVIRFQSARTLKNKLRLLIVDDKNTGNKREKC